MSISSYTSNLGFPQYSDDDQSHGTGERNKWETLDNINSPENIYFVSPTYTAANMPHATNATDQRHFDTIQKAIDAAEPALGYTQRPTIIVYPGQYDEALAIDDSITIVAAVGQHAATHGGGRGVLIRGDGTADSVITITPPDSQTISVNFMGIAFENSYSASNATKITEPYLLDVVAQGVVGTHPIWVGFKDCDIRMQTWGDNNSWAYGIRAQGWTSVIFDQTQVAGYGYAGDNDNGGIEHLIYSRGINDVTKLSQLSARNCQFDNSWLSTGTGDIVNVDNGVIGTFGRCDFDMDYAIIYTEGTTGTNNIVGLTSSSFDKYRNSDGVDLIFS